MIALALAKDIISNWRPVPRPKPGSQDEVDTTRVKRMLVCAEYKAPSWIKFPRRFLFSVIFVLVNFLHVIYIIIKKVHIIFDIEIEKTLISFLKIRIFLKIFLEKPH